DDSRGTLPWQFEGVPYGRGLLGQGTTRCPYTARLRCLEPLPNKVAGKTPRADAKCCRTPYGGNCPCETGSRASSNDCTKMSVSLQSHPPPRASQSMLRRGRSWEV